MLYRDSQDILVLSSAVASRYYNSYTDGSNSPENYGYPYVYIYIYIYIYILFPGVRVSVQAWIYMSMCVSARALLSLSACLWIVACTLRARACASVGMRDCCRPCRGTLPVTEPACLTPPGKQRPHSGRNATGKRLYYLGQRIPWGYSQQSKWNKGMRRGRNIVAL
jgi:hypothetical protein